MIIVACVCDLLVIVICVDYIKNVTSLYTVIYMDIVGDKMSSFMVVSSGVAPADAYMSVYFLVCSARIPLTRCFLSITCMLSKNAPDKVLSFIYPYARHEYS